MFAINTDPFYDFLMSVSDQVFRWHPARVGATIGFSEFNIIAHRGLVATNGAIENTQKAFDQAMSLPIRGLEFDIRWTKDTEPVVFHDQSLRRVLGVPQSIADMTFAQLRKSFPQIPHMEEVLQKTQKVDLMIELKQTFADWKLINQKLESLLGRYRPQGGFHLISLNKQVLGKVLNVDPKHFILVSMTNIAETSRHVFERDWGGLAAHYLMLSQRRIDRHKNKGQKVGVGFPSSLASLYREYQRGADFIFSNHGQRLLEQHQQRLARLKKVGPI